MKKKDQYQLNCKLNRKKNTGHNSKNNVQRDSMNLLQF